MKKKTFLFAAILILSLAAYQYITQDYALNPSTIYTNAEIITVEESQPSAEAMWVKDGIIEAIGSNEEIKALQKNGIEVVDLKGKTVLPGFIDPHTHPALSGLLFDMVDLSGFKHSSNQEVWDYLKETAVREKTHFLPSKYKQFPNTIHHNTSQNSKICSESERLWMPSAPKIAKIREKWLFSRLINSFTPKMDITLLRL